jgi:acetyl-CoA/propionyl-CoA carboxylase biotin carboxyl carrier protein
LAAARREAIAAFGDDRLILERYLEGARHVEIQVLFDAQGHGVALGERDCSVQRRHQKILEEAPSPAVTPALRRRLARAALRLAGAVGYVGVGTCEFLVDQGGRFAFLEMNTRLQVEHPVTELVIDRDLVADQIRVAEGATLAAIGADRSAVDGRMMSAGHAIEVRLYAEDAEAGFLPATGRVIALRWPTGEGVRVDAGIDPGAEVTDRFDPLLAKVIAHGPNRVTALARLTTALDDTVVLGLTTNLRFLRWLVRQAAVLDGQARTDTLERIWPPVDRHGSTLIPEQAWTAAATALGAGSWRLNGPPVARLATEGDERVVRIDAGWSPAVEVALDGDVAHVDIEGRSVAFRLARPPDVGETERAAIVAHHGDGPVVLTAPMPGTVLATHVGVGVAVVAGDQIVTLEAMKMEHAVPAPHAGRVVELAVAAGDQVVRGQPLAVIEAL